MRPGIARLSDNRGWHSSWLRNGVMLFIGASLFSVLFSHISINDLVTVLSRADGSYLSVAILAGFTVSVLRTIRYGRFFPARGRWINLYGAFALMRLLNSALPFRSGELVSLSILKKYRLSPNIAETVPVWILLRVTDVIIISTLFFLALATTSLTEGFHQKLQSVQSLLLGITGGLVAIMMCLLIFLSRLRTWVVGGRLLQWLSSFHVGVQRIRSVQLFLGTLALTALIWGALATLTIFAQLAFSTPLPIWSCFFASVTVFAIGLLPVHSPLGIGTGEAAWVGAMMLLDVGADEAITIAISVRLVTLSSLGIEGLIGYFLLRVGDYR